MDELDYRIIEILRLDGRASNAGIARKVGVSEGTVRRRLKRLISDDYISVVALPDPARMGYAAQALVGIQVDPDKVDLVADRLSEFDAVEWVKITTGSFDVFAWATLSSSDELGIFLRTQVGTVPGVRRTETFVNLDSKKRGPAPSYRSTSAQTYESRPYLRLNPPPRNPPVPSASDEPLKQRGSTCPALLQSNGDFLSFMVSYRKRSLEHSAWQSRSASSE